METLKQTQRLVEEVSEKAVAQIIHMNYLFKQQRTNAEYATSIDSQLEINQFNSELISLVTSADYEEAFQNLIPNKAKWGKNIKFKDLFVYNHKHLTESLTCIKNMAYIKTYLDGIDVKQRCVSFRVAEFRRRTSSNEAVSWHQSRRP
jgi:hypothetical protein